LQKIYNSRMDKFMNYYIEDDDQDLVRDFEEDGNTARDHITIYRDNSDNNISDTL